MEEALRLSKDIPHCLGVTCRRTEKYGISYGLRAQLVRRDKVAVAAGRLAGAKYTVQNVPIDWICHELRQLAESLGWRAEAVPTSQRMKKGHATWAMRATQPPSHSSIAV